MPASRAATMATKNFVFLPASRPPPESGAHALVYFIPGNPGFIDWYAPFLETLRAQLDDIQKGVAFDIYGRSLLGFHDDEHAPFTRDNPPYSLEDQIAVTYDSLAQRRIPGDPEKTAAPDGGASGRPYDFVVIIGHSVGAYIGLEVFHRHQLDPSPAPHLRPYHGILLCPTITHIADSPCGRFFTRVCSFALLSNYLHVLLALLTRFIPAPLLYAWCRFVMGFAPRAAETAAVFLKSRDAIWQALHMGRDEMEAIAEDKWEDELWEVLDEGESHRLAVPKFWFLFAETDHWVAPRARDKFIAKMKSHAERDGPEHKKGRTEIVVDDGAFPHAFCTKEKCIPIVATKVKDWLARIQESRAAPG